jgi:hypothetical protein
MLTEETENLDLESSIELLEGQIKKANLLLGARPADLKEYAKWNEETRRCLVRVFGPNSPNVPTIVEFCGVDPPWPYMRSDWRWPKEHNRIQENYAASCLKDRSRLLAACVVTLKVRLGESERDP